MTDIDLAFDDVGRGDVPMILIHGAYSSRRVFGDQIQYFKDTHRVIVPDLRGHGESPKPEGPYSIGQLANDIGSLIQRLGITTPANVVGHSIGGVVAADLAAHLPHTVRAIATLDSPSLIPNWAKSHKAGYEGLDGEAQPFRQIIREYLDAASSPVENPGIRNEELEEYRAVPDHVLLAVWHLAPAWSPEDVLPSVKQPFLYIDHGQPNLEFDRLRELCPQLIIGKTVGAGHRALREVPDQVNSMLGRFFEHSQELANFALNTRGEFMYRSDVRTKPVKRGKGEQSLAWTTDASLPTEE